MRTKERILTDILGYSFQSGQEQLFHCPFCKHHKRKLSVNIEKNVYKCWICDSTGKNIGRIVRQFGSFQDREEWMHLDGRVNLQSFDNLFEEKQPEPEATVDLPDAFVSLANKTLPKDAAEPLRYLLEHRGLTKSDILKWKIGFCKNGPYHGRIIVPSFNKEGFCNYFVARTYKNDDMRYKNPPVSKNIVFNELYVDWSQPIILVEGIFDAIRAGNAIPLLGSTLREGSRLFQELASRNATVYLALDPDAKDKTTKIMKLLMSYDVPVYTIDVDGFEDVAEMSTEQFDIRKEQAAFISNSDYLLQRLFAM